MARISEQELERIKREVSLERLAEARGVKLKRHGADLHGRCPFHDDRTPSLVITPSKNVWHCLGACQAGGSVIDWVMRAEGVSFRHAVELLRKDFPFLAASENETPSAAIVRRSTVKKLEVLLELEEPDAQVLGRVADYYHATLKESDAALAYLKQRGLMHTEVIEHFKLGYANRTLGYRLPDKNRKAGEALRGQLQRLGVFRQSGHEHLSGSLVIPIFDEAGGVVEMYGRKITPGLREGTPLHLYLPGPHRGVFNAKALEGASEVILCEALIDALSFWCAGYRNVTSAYGVEGFTEEHWELLSRHGVERVYIAYDRDEAGNKAAQKLGEELGARGIEALRVLFPRNMDANEYTLKVKPVEQALSTLLRTAQWIGGPTRASRPSPRATAPMPSVPDGGVEESTLPLTAAPAAAPASPAAADAHDEVDACVGSSVEPAAPADPFPYLAAFPVDAAPAEPPPAASAEVLSAAQSDEVSLELGPRRWRVRGLLKNTSLASIKVSVRVMVGTVFFQDQIDVLSARARASFLGQARDELGEEERVLKADLGRVILRLEELLEKHLRRELETKAEPQMSEADEAAALSFLRDPKLLERIAQDFDSCGVVGEETNKLLGYLAAVSRKLEAPLGVVIQSSSAAGKSALMDAILRFVPEEEQVSYSAMTGQSLFYMGSVDLQHKVLGIAEEQGASHAAYALKILQSAGELTIASTGKDPTSGRLVTHEYKVTGPVMVMMTTTSIEVDEELLNRCVILTVDEGREQTRAIQRLQREGRTLEGLLKKQARGRLLSLHQNAQRLLQPLHVVNPFAQELSFADYATRTRRDHAKYLTLIDAIALLHQHQRPVKTAEVQGAELRYIEVTRADIELASRLAERVLSRSLDELAPQTRRLLGIIDALVGECAKAEGVERSDVRFTQRELREYSGWGQTQLKVHLRTLSELEYVAVHCQGHRQRFVYELLVSTVSAAPSALAPERAEYDANRSGKSSDRSGTGRSGKRPVLSSKVATIAQPVGRAAIADTAAASSGTSYSHPSLVAAR